MDILILAIRLIMALIPVFLLFYVIRLGRKLEQLEQENRVLKSYLFLASQEGFYCKVSEFKDKPDINLN